MKSKQLLLSICILTLGLNACASKEKIIFKINGKEKHSYARTIEYQDALSYAPKDIGLTAFLDDKDITKKIKYKKIKIDELKTYKIKYTIDNESFTYEMKVVDTSAPIIHVEDLTVDYGTEFSYDMLNVSIEDNFDKNLSSNITYEGNVDTSNAGDYKVLIRVQDSSKNKSEKEINVHVNANQQTLVNNSSNENHNISNNEINNKINVVSNPSSIQVLINKQHKLPENYAPNDLVNLEGNHYLRSEAANSFIRMKNDAKATSGITMNLVSSYRTKEYQANLYNNYYATDPVNAPFYSALPRTSEHELGLAIDISYDYLLHEDLQNYALGRWMANNAHKYGWIMRYPYGKSHITGYIFEAWHYRYVGVDLATKLKSNNITLEEYYG